MDFNTLLKIESYIENLFAEEDSTLLKIKESMSQNDIPAHNIFPNQSKFIQFLLKANRSKNILEIGTLAGYSTVCIARAIPGDGKVITIEIENHFADIAQSNFKMAGLENKIQIIRGEALSVLKELEDTIDYPFDFIFMDAHKPSYIDYFNWSVRHSRSGTLIVADNVIRNGDVLSQKNTDEKALGMIAYNKMLSKRNDIDSIIIPNISGNGYDGMALSIVK